MKTLGHKARQASDLDFDEYIGVRIVSATKERVVGRLTAGPQHMIESDRIHGGLIIALAETLAGRGATLNLPAGCATTTIELKTNFMQAGRLGPIFGVAEPLHLGRSTMVWQTSIHDEDERRLAVVQQTQIVMQDRVDDASTGPVLVRDSAPDAEPTVGEERREEAQSTFQQRRAQIIAAAFPLIAKNGFSQTSVREIAQAAGLSVPAVYKYVANKDEILALIFDDYVSQIESRLAGAAGGAGSPSEKLRQALATNLAEFDRYRSEIRMMHRETRHLRPEVRERVKKHFLRYIEPFHEILEEGVEAGEFREIDARLVANLISLLCDVWPLRRWSVGEVELETVQDGVSDLVLNGIRRHDKKTA